MKCSIWYGRFADPFFFGDYPATMRSRVGSRLPKFTEKEAALVNGSLDFMGINHYTTFYTKDDQSTVIEKLLNNTLADTATISVPFRNGQPIGDRVINSATLHPSHVKIKLTLIFFSFVVNLLQDLKTLICKTELGF
jgi:beta-glucosidase/6-phospho-beta-glucosidase/beta-galactosidase